MSQSVLQVNVRYIFKCLSLFSRLSVRSNLKCVHLSPLCSHTGTRYDVNYANGAKLKPALGVGKRKIGEYMRKHGLSGFEPYIAAADLVEGAVADASKKFIKDHGSVPAGCRHMMQQRNIKPGSSWGSASVMEQEMWDSLQCNTERSKRR